jgi:hypothetical protein
MGNTSETNGMQDAISEGWNVYVVVERNLLAVEDAGCILEQKNAAIGCIRL